MNWRIAEVSFPVRVLIRGVNLQKAEMRKSVPTLHGRTLDQEKEVKKVHRALYPTLSTVQLKSNNNPYAVRDQHSLRNFVMAK